MSDPSAEHERFVTEMKAIDYAYYAGHLDAWLQEHLNDEYRRASDTGAPVVGKPTEAVGASPTGA